MPDHRRPDVALVTGGGGFVGRHLVRQLVAQGDTVRTLGRNRYPHLPPEVTQHTGSILNDVSLAEAIAGTTVVYHAAALASSFGDPREFDRVNVEGTRRVLDACRDAGVRRLVYTSSPSVVFGHTGHIDADESLPYPDAFLADYPRTKAEAERLVLAADAAEESGELRTVAIRPHLVFGPQDGSLLPRIVDRARRGRLRIVGPGDSPISVAYVENVAAAHRQAADELAGEARCGGRAYFINEPEALTTKVWINRLLGMAGQPPCERHVSPRVAYAAGATLETLWRLTGKTTEPPMTRFVAKQLSEPHSFRIDAAVRDFGYAPPVDWNTALARTSDWAAAAFEDKPR